MTLPELEGKIPNEVGDLLKACLNAFNQLPNQKINGNYPSTYALATQIDSILQQITLKRS
ncbi:cobalamin biosynthesis protein CbiX (plasmid) [Xenorhabdus stockiae]|uniref:cobalamin biosynthesis protein CbiX n=1 Tax=Xenorhabdus stockiae TaxID=351614 RepID=UPI003CF218F3